MAENTEVIPRTRTEILNQGEAIIQLRPMLDAIPKLGEQGEDEIALRILTAETLEDVFAAVGAQGLVDFLNTPIMVMGIRWGESSFENGLGVFLVVDALAAGDRRVTLTTGAATPMVQLVKAHALGRLKGLTVIPRKAETPTKNGYYPLHLELVTG